MRDTSFGEIARPEDSPANPTSPAVFHIYVHPHLIVFSNSSIELERCIENEQWSYYSICIE
jgi:hypothetical protein